MEIFVGLLIGIIVAELAESLNTDRKWKVWSEKDFDRYQNIEKEKYLLFKSEQNKNKE